MKLKIAAIDIGSNTVFMLIASVSGHGLKEVLAEENEVVRLGQGIHKNKRFHPLALKRANQCLQRYSSIIEEYGVDKVVAVATSATREAQNKEELLDIGRQYGLSISVISGNEEARLTYKGSTFDLDNPHEYTVIDVGGGSTEVMKVDQRGELCGCSVDVGSVRLTEMFIQKDPISREEIQRMDSYVHQCLQDKQAQMPSTQKVVAVAGTPTTLASIVQGLDFSEERIHGYHLTLQEISTYRDLLAQKPLSVRKKVKGLPASRADLIVSGTSILKAFVECLGVNEVRVSTKGVRYGLVLS